nr:unnamed protein product [Haemonchus contortus]
MILVFLICGNIAKFVKPEKGVSPGTTAPTDRPWSVASVELDFFAPRLSAAMRHEKTEMEHSNVNLKANEKFEEVEEKVGFNKNLMDTPFWRDAPLHHMHNVETDLDGATAAWITEQAFTKTEYIGGRRNIRASEGARDKLQAPIIGAQGNMSSMELCPEELEKLLLDENTTAEQLASIKATLERLSKKVDNLAASEAQQQNRQGSEEGPSRSVVYEQLNAGDFDNVEYHVDFDPVAAAQGVYGSQTTQKNGRCNVLQEAKDAGFDLDSDVEEIPLNQHKPVYDASGNRMSFEGAVRLTLQTFDGQKHRIALFVMSGGDNTMVLGTNVLQQLGYGLIRETPRQSAVQPQNAETSDFTPLRKLLRKSQQCNQTEEAPTTHSVNVVRRVYIKSGETKSVPVWCENFTQGGIFWATDHLFPDMVWDKETQELNLPVTNTFAGAKIFRVGEEVGTFEPTEVVEVEPVTYHGDMLECTAEVPSDREERLLRFLRDNRTTGEHNEAIGSLVKRYAQVFAVSEQELTQTTLVEHNIDTGDAPPIRQKARPVPLALGIAYRVGPQERWYPSTVRGLPQGQSGDKN